MRHHVIVWAVALFAVALASLVHFSRQTTARTADSLEDPLSVVDRALNLLETDANALRPETQKALRAAAVLAEAGEINSARGAYLLGRQYEREGDFRAAEGLYKKAIALEPDWNWPYGSLGNLLVLHSIGRAEEAMDVLQKCIKLDPEWGRPYGIMAVLLRSEKRYEEALEPAQLALKYWPDSIVPLNNYANLLVDLERFDEAEEYYRRAIESFPDHPKPYYNLACLYTLIGRKEDALANLREAFQRSDALRYAALDDSDFASLKGDSDFEALVRRNEKAPDFQAGVE